jgi:hypothetical protein
MRHWSLACVLLAALQGPATRAQTTIAFTGGHWFDGAEFRSNTLYASDGRFTDQRPVSIDTVVDLRGLYVVPPFGEAHNHNIISAWTYENQGPTYLEQGIFYVLTLGNSMERVRPLRATLSESRTLDVAFSHASVTSPGGHPEPLYRRLAERGVVPGLHPDSLEGVVFFSADDPRDLDGIWPRMRAMAPDVIKAHLLFTADPELPRAGLEEDVLRRLVTLAGRDSLRVITHVETATDFRIAVESGADIIAHVPGYSVRAAIPESVYIVTEEMARQAAERRVAVITTTVWSRENLSAAVVTRARAIQQRNLRTLLDAGVTLAVGSDAPQLTARAEALYLHDLGPLDASQLLRAWTEVTPRLIFPSRQLGRLAPGYEASLVALECDPLEDFNCVTRIAVRVKQGHVLP